MKIAVLYQAAPPPPVHGIQKPMKEGGYRDSGADIAYCLVQNGTEIILPTDSPSIGKDLDWVFPDTESGIQNAIKKGADTFWLNTVLYDSHPILKFSCQGYSLIGQDPRLAQNYDDKALLNSLLQKQGFPIISHQLIRSEQEYSGKFPCILKPVRGRGSQGVTLVHDRQELGDAITSAVQSQKYGSVMMAEPFLSGREVTISVFPDGRCLPPVERVQHQNGIMPYNGSVPVSENSRAVLLDKKLHLLCESCSQIVVWLHLKALCRIDARMDQQGNYQIFDVNLKPNMTGASRPHRMDQDSLTMIAAKAMGWDFYDLLTQFMQFRWKF